MNLMAEKGVVIREAVGRLGAEIGLPTALRQGYRALATRDWTVASRLFPPLFGKTSMWACWPELLELFWKQFVGHRLVGGVFGRED